MNRKNYRLHIWDIYSYTDTFSNVTKVSDLDLIAFTNFVAFGDSVSPRLFIQKVAGDHKKVGKQISNIHKLDV